MLFNSWQYLFFFLPVIILYYLLPFRHRWKLLLAASYYFYMCWKAEYVLLIILTTLIDYFVGIKLGEATDKLKRRMYLVVSLCSNLGVLFAFKYFNFFNDSIRAVLNQFNFFYEVPAFEILLPVGISFYTFQSLSYIIDIYRDEIKPQKHFGIFALYVAFFPQLVAGPIERSAHLLPQFLKEHKPEYQNFIEGLKLIIWGLFKKTVIADRLAVIVDHVYNQPTEFQGASLAIATYCFAIQIFCDFSGYSDIAIGSARIMGIRLMDNFRTPYLAESIADFWKRWHISLTSWFRDYLYIPLGGNKVSPVRWHINIFIVFLISGLWHGACGTFIVWGLVHMFYYFFSKWSYPLRRKIIENFNLDQFPNLQRMFRICVTFNLVCFAWIFFRANSLSDALYISKHIFYGWDIHNQISVLPAMQLFVFAVCLLPAIFKYFIKPAEQQEKVILNQIFYAVVMNFIIFFGMNSNEAFIYFQF